MWRGVKTSTWSPQLLFVSDTHNNLLSIPTSTNHTLEHNIFWVWYLQGSWRKRSNSPLLRQLEFLWKPTQIFFPQLVRKCLTAENIGGFQLVRGSVVSPVLWNCSKFLKLRDPVSMSIPGTGRVAVAANKVGFYVGLGGHYVNIFIGVLPGLIWITGKLLGLALWLLCAWARNHLRPGRSGLCLGKCPGRRTQKHGAIQSRWWVQQNARNSVNCI